MYHVFLSIWNINYSVVDSGNSGGVLERVGLVSLQLSMLNS